jgi:Tol biopolymer transport system component
MIRSTSRFISFALLVLALAPVTSAQYFGRNKVQWENFDFKVLRTEHFDIYYYDQEKDVVADAGRIAERWYERLSRVFEHEFTRKPFVLYANHADFQQTTTTSGLIGEGTGGFTDAFQNRMVLPLTGNWADNDHVIGHELVHVFQFDIANSAASQQRGRRFDLSQLPLWLVEGMAEYLSKGRIDPLTAMWLRDATDNNRLPDLRQLTRDPRFFPYRYGQALLAYVGGRYGDAAVVNLFLAAGVYGLEESFSRALGVSHEQLFKDWHASARELYEPVFLRRPETLGKPLIGNAESRRGDLNIGPSMSPDGRWVAFLSSRELFSIDLFIADAQTGEVRNKVVSSGRDPHFDALRFIDSAGAWSPDSRKLAVVVFERGDNRLAIIDVESRSIEQRIAIPGVDALASPAWSPDGRSIAFSAQSTGVSDIIVYDLETKQVRRLTDDRYSDLQPVWSPDGRTIAFASDRGAGTDLALLEYNDLRISTVDVETGTVQTLPLFDNGKHINPQYGPEGSLYFIANPDGIANVYRYANGRLERMTNVATGVAGITQLSPALAVSMKTGRTVFSVFESDNYNIYSVPSNAQPEVVTASLGADVPRAAVLPPLRGTPDTITAYLERPAEGLPAPETPFQRLSYRPDLRLTYLGPPSFGVGANTAGEFGLGGSVSALFSDVLGEHLVGVTFQGGSSTGGLGTLFGGEVFYLNQENRFNWGGGLTHIPYISAFTIAFEDVIEVDGQPVQALIVEQRREITLLDEASVITRYPFSRTRRVEASAGYQRLGFDLEVFREVYVGGQLIDDDVETLDAPESINFFLGSAAFVGDSSVWGFISPVNGTRYRYEVEGYTGDLTFQTALADWRKYWFARPVTFAVRGLHYGRYGDDAEDNRISPLFLGNQSLIRGYEIDSFSGSECNAPEGTNECPVFDRLVGSKIGLVSAEVRVPLVGTTGYGLINAPSFPVELTGFFDVGVAWTEDEDAEIKWDPDSSERVPVASAGVALRILLAYIPLELYYAKPLHRPEEDWVFGFAIKPGW